MQLSFEELGWTWRLFLAGFATTVGCSIPVGYTIGVVNTPAEIIKQWCNESIISRYDITLNSTLLDGLWSTIVSIFLVGGMIGSLVGGVIADRIGRRKTIAICGGLSLVAAASFVVAKPANSVELMLVGRILMGLASGLVTAVVPMYMMELAPVNLRGSAGVLCPLGINFGVAAAQALGFAWGTESCWNFLLGAYAMLVVMCSLCFPLLPESPHYLYSVLGHKPEALKELSKLRNLPSELIADELTSEPVPASTDQWTICKVLRSKEMRLNLALVCALQAGQQFSGINAVFYYSTSIFSNAGLSDSTAKYASFSAGVINFITAAAMIPTINIFPRRFLTLVSCTGATVFLVLLSFSINFMNVYPWLSYAAVVCVLTYVISYGIALGPIPYFIGTELFDVGPRPSAMALGSVSNWTGNFVVGMTFLQLQTLIGHYSFLIFAAITAALTIFIKICLPETNPRVITKEGLIEEMNYSLP